MKPLVDPRCAHCGAEYRITWLYSAWPSQGSADCVQCGREMDRWNSTTWPSYSPVKQENRSG